MSSPFRLARFLSGLTLLTAIALPAHAISFGSKDKVKVVNGGPLKEGTTFALGSFRVCFITEDEVVSVAKGSWVTGGSSSSAAMSGSLEGLDQATMQKIADKIYADFLKQAAGRGVTLTDSVHLAQASPTYKAMQMTANYSTGRMGTMVIPTGQQSVPLAEDASEKSNKGSKGLMSQWKQMGATDFATADANKLFPVAAKEAGMPVLGVTIVVNFADFKGGNGSFGNSKVGMMPGATIEGSLKTELLRATSIVAWGPKTATCPACMAQALLEGTVHSTEPIGSTETHKGSKGISGLVGIGPTNSYAKKGTTIYVDLPAYETNVLAVAAEANEMLVAELGRK